MTEPRSFSAKEIVRTITQVGEQLSSICRVGYRNPQVELLLGRSNRTLRTLMRSTATYKALGVIKTIKRFLGRASVHNMGADLAYLDELQVFSKRKPFVALVDLAAFPLAQLKKGACSVHELEKRGISDIVLMEDRNPLFFLNYKGFKPSTLVPLSKHQCLYDNDLMPWTMQDMKDLIDLLHAHDIRVHIGFWGHIDDNAINSFVQSNRESLCSAIAGSDDLNPLSFVKSGSEIMTFGQYVADQYRLLQKDFGFDGLFLGDGLMGYRSFLDPLHTGDYRFAAKGWETFYAQVSKAVRKSNGQLMSFDVMGRTYEDALASGVDYHNILRYVDRLFVQTYGGTAWNHYMHIPGYTQERDVSVMKNLKKHLSADLRSKIGYTLELRDSVEGWEASQADVASQVNGLESLSHAKLGVWSNDVVREILMRPKSRKARK